MHVRDRDYLFGRSTRKVPTEAEIVEMVEAIIPWSEPLPADREEPFSTAKMKSLFPEPEVSQLNSVKGVEIKPQIPLGDKLPAGFTYWGQWIAHDIITPTHPLQNHYSSRQVTPILNLDSLYGCAQGLPSHIFFDEYGMFKLADNGWDCLRDCGGAPLLPEPRNNDNAIILQFHVQWQRVHNRILRMLGGATPPFLHADPTVFYTARYFTTCLFHQLVLNEWLPAILDKAVYKYYFSGTLNGSVLMQPDCDVDRVPFEFSHAAFRFGHSMVRETYKLRGNDSFNLHALLTHQPFKGKAIPPIDWGLFFGEFAQEIQPINLIIVAGMGNIPIARNIAERNISAGIKASLATVHECKYRLCTYYPELARAAGLTLHEEEAVLEELKIDPMQQSASFYRLYQDERLPLWPYILAEAGAQEDNPGHRLGKLGSIIIADVMKFAIDQAAPESRASFSEVPDYGAFLHTFCSDIGVSDQSRLTMADLLTTGENNNERR
ncbi:peroxidase family protein [Aestuariibacter sp. A3R04]|uniref:peroxidase family protein n=1 Tax=Aestuariibacter sp. A3R04 TaxID=2841571 RepID=UPI001C0862DD|nr:peroxidase family protein [Aestuariibacter sp. A3R04]MBU3020913.1 hypothetical protein [Aestuariibacter sp. A3R04]